MDTTKLKAAWAEFYAWLKTVPGILWTSFLASSIKTKGVLAVVVAIAGMWGFDKLPSRDQVASNLPDYATSSDVKSVKGSIDTLTADIRQMQIELSAVQAKLSEPSKVETGSVAKPKAKHC
jgi:hypothetical protein